MPDREKVIAALENCVAEEKCRNCPWDECDGMGHETVDSVPRSLLLDALELLKEQEAIIKQYRRADGFLAVHGWKWEGR